MKLFENASAPNGKLQQGSVNFSEFPMPMQVMKERVAKRLINFTLATGFSQKRGAEVDALRPPDRALIFLFDGRLLPV